MQNFFSLLFQRLISETPKFFQVIVGFGLTLGGIGGTLILLGSKIPTPIQNIAGYLVTIGLVAAAVAKSTTTNARLKARSEEILK